MGDFSSEDAIAMGAIAAASFETGQRRKSKKLKKAPPG